MRTDLAALIGSRICHDLISPIGAIGNGVELLALSSDSEKESPELDLITESVENASARIKFFRIAYGACSAQQQIGRNEVISVLAASACGGRLAYFWNIAGDQSRNEVRAVFLALQCFETALPLGGTIDINKIGDTWELKGTGRRLVCDNPLWDHLKNPRGKTDFAASEVQFALLPSAIYDIRRKLDVEQIEDILLIRF